MSNANLELRNAIVYYFARIIKSVPVLKRVYPSLLKNMARIVWRGGYRLKRYFGSIFLLNFNNYVDREISLHGAFEPAQTKYFLSQLEKQKYDMFLDIGANFGLYSINVARSGLVKEIHSFEPDVRNFYQLSSNIYLNKFFDLIKPYKIALSDKEGEVEFEMNSDFRTGNSKVVEGGLLNENNKVVKVPTSSLDILFPFKDKYVAIKIDVEGHEKNVLAGAHNFLKGNKCFIQIEAWDENYNQVKLIIESLGYKEINKIEKDCYFVNF